MSVQSNGTFGVVLCSCCKEFWTNHRCLAWVLIGGFSLENSGRNKRVCGLPICSICSTNFGNEGISQCECHFNDDEDDESTAEEVETTTTNTNPQSNPPPAKTMINKATKKKTKLVEVVQLAAVIRQTSPLHTQLKTCLYLHRHSSAQVRIFFWWCIPKEVYLLRRSDEVFS